MAVSLSPIGGAGAQFFDNNGVPLAGGKLYSYEAGTTTPKTTYTSASGTTANTNPIILNSAGRPPQEIWLTTNEAYKFVLTDSTGTLIGTWDNIYGYSSGSIAYAATEVQTATAGQTLFILTEMVYNPGTNTLAVYVDGVNQVVENAYVETSSTSVTFMSGLHVGATVKFVNVSIASSDATVVTYEPGFTGSVATTVAAKLQQTVSVMDFGAVGDGVTDDTAAIQAAADYCESSGAQLIGVPGTFKTSATITLNCSGDLSPMTISCPGATVSPVIQVGKTTGSLFAIRLYLRLPKVNNSSKTTTGWSGFENAVGVDLGNLYYSEITIPRVYGFGINLYVGGHTVGNAYNNLFVNQLVDGKVNMKIGARAPGAWSNENNYYCGGFSRSTSEGTSPITGAYSIWFDGITGTNVNNNVLYKPSVETSSDEYQFNFENASVNTIINPRFEVPGGGRIRFYSATTGDTSDNSFFGGYQVPQPTFTFDGAASLQNKYYGSRYGDSLEFTGNGLQLVNGASSSISAPHIQGFDAGQRALGKTASSTNWTYRLYANGLDFKQAADAYSRININGSTNTILVGNGSAAPVAGIQANTSNLVLVTPTGAAIRANFDNTVDFGLSNYRWANVYATQVRPGAGTAIWTSGSGSPEGVVTAVVGSLYTRTNGGAGTTLYVKESGSGNTGWAAK